MYWTRIPARGMAITAPAYDPEPHKTWRLSRIWSRLDIQSTVLSKYWWHKCSLRVSINVRSYAFPLYTTFQTMKEYNECSCCTTEGDGRQATPFQRWSPFTPDPMAGRVGHSLQWYETFSHTRLQIPEYNFFLLMWCWQPSLIWSTNLTLCQQ